jgi:Family of unknown function (DUF6526)
MAESVQTYKNHARVFPLFHYFVLPVLLFNALNALRHVYYQPNRSTIFSAVVASAFVAFALAARQMVVTVQDRVIRLEMRTRLRALLQAPLSSRINDLTPQQLVALRFASDAELSDLVRDVLDGKLATTKAIKMRVKDWQGDFLRA